MLQRRFVLKRGPASGFVAVTILATLRGGPTAAVDFAASAVDLLPLGGSTYDAVPQVGLRVGTALGGPVPLEYQLLVNGTPAASGLAQIDLGALCAGPGCSGACKVLADGQLNDGSCLVVFEECECVVIIAPLPALHGVTIPPGSTCRLVLDPQGLVAETDETNNTYTTTLHATPASTAAGALALALALLVLAHARRRASDSDSA
jgi:hypothetical protein